MTAYSGRGRSARDERGVVFPSPVVMLSVVAVAVATIAFVATRDSGSGDKDITTISESQSSSSSSGASSSASGSPSGKPTATKPAKPKPPAIDRSKTYVVVFNNSGITGLAGQVAAQASQIGWQVVGADNWYGTIPASTVYYPPRMERAGKLLALDLGIQRTLPSVDPMRLDRLTVILTGPLDSSG